MPLHRRAPARAFTLVELLVVIGIMALLLGILMPALAKARAAANTAKCLANIRNMEIAHTTYLADQQNRLIEAGVHNGVATQGSWIDTLQPYFATPLLHRCPSDESPYFPGGAPLPGSSPPAYRVSSYVINNYVSPSYPPPGVAPYVKVTQVRRAHAVVQFLELVETGDGAGYDHLHVEDWYIVGNAESPRVLGARQVQTHRHGGRRETWDARANYGFLDGHAETLRFRDVYVDPTNNRFNPNVAQ